MSAAGSVRMNTASKNSLRSATNGQSASCRFCLTREPWPARGNSCRFSSPPPFQCWRTMTARNARCTAYGCTRDASPGFKRCKPCRQHVNALLRARVSRRRRLGLCPCGRTREPRRKLCRRCLDYFNGRSAELGESRIIDGVCTQCGSPNLAVRVLASGEVRQLKVCERHREARNEQWKPGAAHRRNKERRMRQALAKHRCVECRRPAHYDAERKCWRRLCLGHLEAANERFKRWYERKKKSA